MFCPNCRESMEARPSSLGAYWLCHSCQGRLLEAEALDRMVDPACLRRLWQIAGQGDRPGRRSCPFCYRAMTLVPGAADGTPPLDACNTCKVAFFDALELETVASKDAAAAGALLSSTDQKEIARVRREMLIDEAEEDLSGPGHPALWIPLIMGLPVEKGGAGEFRQAWGTWIMAIVIISFSLIGFLSENYAVILGLGLKNSAPFRYGGITFITSFLLHGNWWHLIGNVYFLLIFGDNVEEDLGWKRWLALVVMAALIGDVLSLMVAAPGSETVSIGASGGIAGLLAYYSLRFPKNRIMVFIWMLLPLRMFVNVRAILMMPAAIAFAWWIGMQLMGTTSQMQGTSNVGYFAHLGGALGGVAFWAIYGVRGSASPTAA
ncbi:MAG: hypothetical protein BIFFINMI_03901 [Phycisphaerae bacterium]|nr:hypothetical protein [Phycisphaerae bacterium]